MENTWVAAWEGGKVCLDSWLKKRVRHDRVGTVTGDSPQRHGTEDEPGVHSCSGLLRRSLAFGMGPPTFRMVLSSRRPLWKHHTNILQVSQGDTKSQSWLKVTSHNHHILLELFIRTLCRSYVCNPSMWLEDVGLGFSGFLQLFLPCLPSRPRSTLLPARPSPPQGQHLS